MVTTTVCLTQAIGDVTGTWDLVGLIDTRHEGTKLLTSLG